MDDAYVPRTQRGLYGNIVVWVIALTVLGCAITAGLWGFGVIFAPQIGKGEARKTINSGDFRITAYNRFFDLCASVQGLEGQLDAQKALLPDTTGDTRDRILTNIAGIEGARAQAIAQYDADARKDYTIGQFRSNNLPYQLPVGAYTGGRTSCVA